MAFYQYILLKMVFAITTVATKIPAAKTAFSNSFAPEI